MHGTLPLKTIIDVERLLQWAYREELAKRFTSSAEDIWQRTYDIGIRGGVALERRAGSAQRYDFGLPHPDATRIEEAIRRLPDQAIDWHTEAETILGALTPLLDTKTSQRPPQPQQRASRASWRTRGGRKMTSAVDPPRQVIMVRSLRTSSLVVMHAKMGTRPDWRSEPPQPEPVPAAHGPNPAIIGECRGRNWYSIGTYCPLKWWPSPISIAEARADYLAWWRGLNMLLSVQLEKFTPTPPAAVEMPWRVC
jgi:hypothetical protein